MFPMILVAVHTGRPEPVRACREVCDQILEAGVIPVVAAGELQAMGSYFANRWENISRIRPLESADFQRITAGIVLGGDGTILRTLRLLRDGGASAVPTVGVNMGHVGFLAESTQAELKCAVARILSGNYKAENRMALTVKVYRQGELIASDWALNDAAIERSRVERMIELALAVDQQGVMSFGCNGMVVATPTGSTAYAFSAGGPIVWPGVQAMLVVPVAAHALFARPMVVGAACSITVELLPRNEGQGLLCCDGQTSHKLLPGDHVVFRRDPQPVVLGRLDPEPFSARLVKRFSLPQHGWRGPIEGD